MVALNSTFHSFPASVTVEQITIVDDFDELSNSFSLKIGFLFTILTDFFISNALAMLFILYDKYGEDSMKRPIYNRLNSQFAYPVIISNLLSRPAWTWRVIFGPISSTAADVAVLIGKGQGYNIIDYVFFQRCKKSVEGLVYRTRAIITRGLYIFYPLFEVQKRFFKGLFS